MNDSVLGILTNHPDSFRKYETLLEEQKYPSLAILEMTKDNDTLANVQPLLDLLSDRDSHADMIVTAYSIADRASDRLLDCFKKEYNELIKSPSDTYQKIADAYALLTLCHKYRPTHEFSGFEDPSHPAYHFVSQIADNLKTMILWYVNNSKIQAQIYNSNILDIIIEWGTLFFNCTTYSLDNSPSDLANQLKEKGFTGVKQTSKELKEAEFKGVKQSANRALKRYHIWVHPDIPMQVRINQKGKLTVGLLREIPFHTDKVLNEALIPREAYNEILKISKKHNDRVESIAFIIPASSEENIKQIWSKRAATLENGLMGSAHRFLNIKNMNFDHVDSVVISIEKPEKEPKKAGGKTKKQGGSKKSWGKNK